MKFQLMFVASVLLIGAASALVAQNNTVGAKLIEDLTKPGPFHKSLDWKVGSWSAKVKSFAAPDAKAVETTRACEITWALDGRYLQIQMDGTQPGDTYRGVGFQGYDYLKEKYVGTWMDTDGTGFAVSEGKFDPESKSFMGLCTVPNLEKRLYTTGRRIEKSVDKDHWTMTMYLPGERNREFVAMEIEYTRK